MLLVLTLSIATGLSFADDAFAQGRPYYFPEGWGYVPNPWELSYNEAPYSYSLPYSGRSSYTYSPYYSIPYYYSTPYYYGTEARISNSSVPQMSSTNPDTTQSQSFYYNPGTTQQSATITVLLPKPDAQLWFENAATQQQGMERHFVSPFLNPGEAYTYTVKAHWMENGKAVDRERHVNVWAGQQSTVDFRTQ